MKIEFITATEKDAVIIHDMKYKAFLGTYERYHDDETNPAKEPIEKVQRQLSSSNCRYFLIVYDTNTVGAVRVVEKSIGWLDISPIFILPEYQNCGIGKRTMKMLFEMFPDKKWRLATILEDTRNCCFYETCGFVRTGSKKRIKDGMTIVGYEKVI